MDESSTKQELEALHAASYSWALACCGYNRAEAQDMLQSSYEKVLDGRARFSGRSSLKTWLFAVIRRTAAESRRRAAVRRVLTLRAARPGKEDALSTDEDRVGPAARTRIIEALSELPPRQREVLELVFYHDLSLAEAAGVMGVTLGSVRTHYHRAKVAMAGRLAPLRETV